MPTRDARTGLKEDGTAASGVTPAPGRRFGAGALAAGSLAGLVAGAVASYFVASTQFAEQSAALAQADELRVQAANQRVAQFQEQLRSVEEQAARQQTQVLQEANAQQNRVVRQIGEQERAVEARQQAIVEQAHQHERDLAKPDLPLKVWVHKPQVGRGLVASVHNFGTKEIALTVTAHRAAAPQGESWSTVIAANASQLIGGDAALQFRPGDSIDVASADYRPMSFQVPLRAKPPAGASADSVH